jgi:16S rRNA (guanine527-N7)-methyltransferase
MKDKRLDLYKKLLLSWDERMNLIGPEVRANLDEHVNEALEAADILQPRGEILDFGSGGGLPAIPMAIACPDARFHMIEASKKKWAFLKHVVRDCKLSAVAYGDRLARVLTRFPADLRFSLVTSRAVGNPDEWLPPLAPWMQPDGRAALFQGTAETPEIHHFRKIATHKLSRGYLVTFHVEQ